MNEKKVMCGKHPRREAKWYRVACESGYGKISMCRECRRNWELCGYWDSKPVVNTVRVEVRTC